MTKSFRSPVMANLTAIILVILAITILLLVNALTTRAQCTPSCARHIWAASPRPVLA